VGAVFQLKHWEVLMSKGRMPFIDIPSGGLSLGSFPLEINAGVTTSHLQKRMAEEIVRRAASEVVKVVEPTKSAAPAVRDAPTDGRK
jgi:hypothetical protein